MAVQSDRTITVQYSGDYIASNAYRALSNATSPAQLEVRTLALGDTVITPPTGATVSKSCTIVMPSGNVATLTLKGIGGDTGVVLSPIDPSSIALNSPTATFILNASAQIAGVRLIWT